MATRCVTQSILVNAYRSTRNASRKIVDYIQNGKRKTRKQRKQEDTDERRKKFE